MAPSPPANLSISRRSGLLGDIDDNDSEKLALGRPHRENRNRRRAAAIRAIKARARSSPRVELRYIRVRSGDPQLPPYGCALDPHAFLRDSTEHFGFRDGSPNRIKGTRDPRSCRPSRPALISSNPGSSSSATRGARSRPTGFLAHARRVTNYSATAPIWCSATSNRTLARSMHFWRAAKRPSVTPVRELANGWPRVSSAGGAAASH